MTLWDVNIWVYAFRSDSPLHHAARDHMETMLQSAEPFLFNSNIAVSFLRLVTNPRIFIQPSDIAEAWAFIDALSSQPFAVETDVDAMTMGVFKHITLVHQSRGNAIPDDLLAAIAIRHDATLYTADSAFTKYEGLCLELIS